MPAPLRITLSEPEEAAPSALQIASKCAYRVHDRAHMRFLNADSSALVMAELFKCHGHTVRAAIRTWARSGIGGLGEKSGQGKQPTWQPSDLEYLELLPEQGRPNVYNSRQLATKL